jgi:hypothetical protein
MRVSAKFAVLVAIVGFFGLLLGHVSAQGPGFSFNQFTTDYFLGQDSKGVSTVTVSETLVINFGSSLDHNITRAIPTEYQGHGVGFKILNVTDVDGTPYPYTIIHDKNNNLVISISPSSIKSAVQTFKISYQTRNIVAFYNNYQEFFPNVNGYGWTANFSEVDAHIYIPSYLATKLQGGHCLAGAQNTQSHNCDITRQDSGNQTTISVQAKNLKPNEAVRAQLIFNKGTFLAPKANNKWLPFLIVAIFLCGASFAFRKYLNLKSAE